MKRRTGEPSTKILRVRCTPAELASYRLLASKRGKSLPDMVRSGLEKVCMQTCLCEVGQPLCLRCRSMAPKDRLQDREKPPVEPRRVNEPGSNQEDEQKQRELDVRRFAEKAARAAESLVDGGEMAF